MSAPFRSSRVWVWLRRGRLPTRGWEPAPPAPSTLDPQVEAAGKLSGPERRLLLPDGVQASVAPYRVGGVPAPPPDPSL